MEIKKKIKILQKIVFLYQNKKEKSDPSCYAYD